jgi:hypothetical protein
MVVVRRKGGIQRLGTETWNGFWLSLKPLFVAPFLTPLQALSSNAGTHGHTFAKGCMKV